MSTFSFDTTSEQVAQALASEIKDKVILVTGATWGGIGADNARVLSGAGAKLVIISGRSQAKLDETTANIKKEFPNANLRSLIIDLSSQKSVRKAAEEVNKYSENIDVLINNAGVMAGPYGKNEDGIERQFGTNHIGHFLFTNLILKKILASPHPRVVNVSSVGHTAAPVFFEDVNFSDGKTYDEWHAYGQSKTANILFTNELNQRYGKQGLVTFSLHPGAIGTNLDRDVDAEAFMRNPPKDYWGTNAFLENLMSYGSKYKTVSQGGATSLIAAFDPSIASQSGAYLVDGQINDEARLEHARPLKYGFKLWTLSEELVGEKFE